MDKQWRFLDKEYKNLIKEQFYWRKLILGNSTNIARILQIAEVRAALDEDEVAFELINSVLASSTAVALEKLKAAVLIADLSMEYCPSDQEEDPTMKIIRENLDDVEVVILALDLYYLFDDDETKDLCYQWLERTMKVHPKEKFEPLFKYPKYKEVIDAYYAMAS